MKNNKFLAILCSSIIFGGCLPDQTLPDTEKIGWTTFQGNSSHNGYVPLTLDPESFTYRWEWIRPNKDSGTTPYINPVVAENGLVYVTEDDYHSVVKMYALKETDGSIFWQHDFGDMPQLNQPSVHNGKIYVTTTGHSDTFLYTFDAFTGGALNSTAFSNQWNQQFSPTIFGETVYIQAGYYGGVTLAFDLSGDLLWESASYGDNDMFTPAVNEDGVYHYSGAALTVLNPSNGSLLFDIVDPSPDETGYSHHGATMLGSLNNVFSFSGDNFSGQASSSKEAYNSRRLVSYDLDDQSINWKSSNYYLVHPASTDGKVFAASSSPLQLDVLNENDGSLNWAWAPTNPAITSFHRNIIVTDNLVFLSSNFGVHAISRDTHEEVWSYPVPGYLSLTSDTLFIAEGEIESTGKLIAISLN